MLNTCIWKLDRWIFIVVYDEKRNNYQLYHAYASMSFRTCLLAYFFSSDFGEAWKWIIRTEPWFSAMLLFSCNQFRTLCTTMAEAAHSMNAWVTFGVIPRRMWLLNECRVLLTLESFEPNEEVSVIVGKFILKLRFRAILIFIPNFYVIEKCIYKSACWYLDPYGVL